MKSGARDWVLGTTIINKRDVGREVIMAAGPKIDPEEGVVYVVEATVAGDSGRRYNWTPEGMKPYPHGLWVSYTVDNFLRVCQDQLDASNLIYKKTLKDLERIKAERDSLKEELDTLKSVTKQYADKFLTLSL